MSLKKKLLCLILCTVIVSSLSITVWAETKTELSSSNKPVQAYYDTTSETSEVYSVDLNWGDLIFKYTTSKGTWNPSSHIYENGTEGWRTETEGGDRITITNHSNVSINATVFASTYYQNENGELPFAVNISKNNETPTAVTSVLLDSPAIGSVNAPSQEFVVSVSGTPEVTMIDKTTIGTVTITLTKAE